MADTHKYERCVQIFFVFLCKSPVEGVYLFLIGGEEPLQGGSRFDLRKETRQRFHKCCLELKAPVEMSVVSFQLQ